MSQEMKALRTLNLRDVVAALTHLEAHAAPEQPLSRVVIDSRQAESGALFVALPGERVDGHDFVADAFRRGAVAALVSRPVEADCTLVQPGQTPAHWQLPVCIQVPDTLKGLQDLATFWRLQFQPTVIGITGSVGKTSTKELTYSVLTRSRQTLKNEGNLNNEIGLPLTLLRLNENHTQVVLEMGMYDVGEIATLCRIARPHVGVITNIGPNHLERLGTIERIVQAKRELVEALPDDGLAILNFDDARVMSMRSATNAPIFTYGLNVEADLWASDIESVGLEGLRFIMHHQDEEIHLKVPLLGRHSVHTALRAAAVGLSQGLHWDEIVAGLQDKAAQLRLVAIPGPNGSLLLDDTYNASPASSIAALNLLAELNAERKIAILGTMAELGTYEEEGHRKVGCRAGSVVDLLITIGEQAILIAEEAIACGLDPAAVTSLQTQEAIIRHLQEVARPGDTILIKGSRSLGLESVVTALSVDADDASRGQQT